jgi:hypothetical protein
MRKNLMFLLFMALVISSVFTMSCDLPVHNYPYRTATQVNTWAEQYSNL